MSSLPLYFDYAATTPVDERVIRAMVECLGYQACFGNPASNSHAYGRQARRAVERAREQVAALVGASAGQIVWTSGATESNNLALKGVAQALLSDERFRSQSQELLVRVLEAYTGALLAQDQIELARAQKRSYREQFQLNQRQFERGNGTRTDTLETQARFNLAQAQEIEARDSQDAALRELERLVGAPLEIADLAPLGERFQVRPLSPASYTAWRDLALAENPELASLRHAVDVARYEVEQNRADFLPRLGLYASTGKSKSGSENTYNQRYETDSVGIQLSVPLFSGGETLAATRQATHRMEKSHYDLDDKVRETLNQVRKMYNQSSSSAAKIRAYEMTVDSARTLVMATRKSIAAGVRVNLDLLNAEQALYSAMNELSKAKYDYLTAWARLRFYAGVLDEADLELVAANFVSGETPARRRDCATTDCPAPLHTLSKTDTEENRSALN